MTTDTPDAPVPAPVIAADGELTERCQSSGDYLAGLIAQGMLETVGRPAKLPELMWPHVDPTVVNAIWNAGVAAGFAGGRVYHRPEWTREGLDRLRTALREAGYRGMARLVTRTATHRRPLPWCGTTSNVGPLAPVPDRKPAAGDTPAVHP